MFFAMDLIGNILIFALNVYFWVIIGSVVISWLVAFDVINVRTVQAQNLMRLLARLTDPVYKPLRKYIPPIAGLDLTPIIIIFGISILKNMIFRYMIMPGMF